MRRSKPPSSAASGEGPQRWVPVPRARGGAHRDGGSAGRCIRGARNGYRRRRRTRDRKIAARRGAPAPRQRCAGSPSRSAITTAAPRTPRSGCGCVARFSASVCMRTPRLPRPCWPRGCGRSRRISCRGSRCSACRSASTCQRHARSTTYRIPVSAAVGSKKTTITLLAARLTAPVMVVIEDAHLMDEASGGPAAPPRGRGAASSLVRHRHPARDHGGLRAAPGRPERQTDRARRCAARDGARTPRVSGGRSTPESSQDLCDGRARQRKPAVPHVARHERADR